jgi:glycosyltransferase involved in cell wall biosynthesis
VYEVARRMRRWVPVDIYVEQFAQSIREMFTAEALSVTRINTKSSPSAQYWFLFPYHLRQDVTAVRRLRNQYDVFITSMFPMHHVARAAGVPRHLAYVLEPFAFFHDPEMIGGFPLWKRLVLRYLTLAYAHLDVSGVKHATRVMTINEGTAHWVKEVYGVEPSRSLLGVDTERFSPRAGDPAFQALRARYRGRKIIIHSTDFTPLKRTWDAVHIVETIRRDVPEVKLLITYSFASMKEVGRLQRYLKKRGLEDHVEILGFVEHKELPYYYSLADAGFYTGIGSGASAASLFVLECMACGTPVVRTHFTHEEVEHGATGFLYDPKEKEAARGFLLRLLTDPELRARFAEAARRKIVETYHWDAAARRILEEARRCQP